MVVIALYMIAHPNKDSIVVLAFVPLLFYLASAIIVNVAALIYWFYCLAAVMWPVTLSLWVIEGFKQEPAKAGRGEWQQAGTSGVGSAFYAERSQCPKVPCQPASRLKSLRHPGDALFGLTRRITISPRRLVILVRGRNTRLFTS